MAFADLLIHQLEVLRRRTGTDRMGQPHDRWDTIARGVPCRATTGGGDRGSGKGGERATERMRDVYEVSHRVFIADDTVDVREDDEVIVFDSAEVEVMPRARVLLKRRVFGRGDDHHTELDCQMLRGPM